MLTFTKKLFYYCFQNQRYYLGLIKKMNWNNET
jgi:hypothetical protein